MTELWPMRGRKKKINKYYFPQNAEYYDTLKCTNKYEDMKYTQAFSVFSCRYNLYKNIAIQYGRLYFVLFQSIFT